MCKHNGWQDDIFPENHLTYKQLLSIALNKIYILQHSKIAHLGCFPPSHLIHTTDFPKSQSGSKDRISK